MFLDISKAFDKVCHEGLIIKFRRNGISGNLLYFLKDFLKYRKQRVVLNGQNWESLQVFHKDLFWDLFYSWFILTTCRWLVVKLETVCRWHVPFLCCSWSHYKFSELNSDLAKISEWAFKWKMSFNPDPSKPAQEVIFSKRLKTVPHSWITFNINPSSLSPAQKRLGLALDSKLTINDHINHILSNVNKSIGLLRKVQPVLPRSSILTIFKTFIRSHFDYADVVYDQSYKPSFHEKRESIQYNTALKVTGAVRGSSSEKRYQELCLESLEHRRWFRKLCQFHNILKSKAPRYLFNVIPTKLRVHNTRCCEIKHN